MEPDHLKPEVVVPHKNGRPLLLIAAAVLLFAGSAANFVLGTKRHCRFAHRPPESWSVPAALTVDPVTPTPVRGQVWVRPGAHPVYEPTFDR